jgi:starvation-inducible outer membrane lipoprotein
MQAQHLVLGLFLVAALVIAGCTDEPSQIGGTSDDAKRCVTNDRATCAANCPSSQVLDGYTCVGTSKDCCVQGGP